MVCQHCGKFLDVYQLTCPRCRNPVRTDGRPFPPDFYSRGRSRVNRLHRKKGAGGLTEGLLWILTGFGLFSKKGDGSFERILALPGPQEGTVLAGGGIRRASPASRFRSPETPHSSPEFTSGNPKEADPVVLEAEYVSEAGKTPFENSSGDQEEPGPAATGPEDLPEARESKKDNPKTIKREPDPAVSWESGRVEIHRASAAGAQTVPEPAVKPDAGFETTPRESRFSQISGEGASDKFEGKGLKKRSKRLASSILQIFLVMGIVSVFFSVFTALMVYLFPMEGSGNKNWIQQAALELPLNAADSNLPEDARPVAAYLTYRKNDVRTRPAEQIFWNEAELNMPLYNQDAVQTLDKSRAIITFDPTNFLDVDENSLVIIKKIEDNVDLGERRSFLVMVDGNLRGRIEATGEKDIQVQVATSAGMATISSSSASQKKAEFSLKINPDRSTSLTVFKGEAALSAQGKTVLVKENETTKVLPDNPPAEPVPIPKPVNLKKPSPGDVYYYRDFPRQIPFKWDEHKKNKGYHLQIARDPLFRERVLDEITDRPSFIFGNLREGNYNWRVSVIAGSGIEGTPSETRSIHVIRDQEPPKLVLQSPLRDQTWKWGEVKVKGQTEPGTKVYVNGKPATIKENGEFSRIEKVDIGVNVIVVEAIDPAGNTVFVSRTLSRKR